MTVVWLVAIGLASAFAWKHAKTAKQRMVIILVVGVFFLMTACGGSGGEDWNLDESTDLTGAIWRATVAK